MSTPTSSGALPVPARRGELRIADRVFVRIATQAVQRELAGHWAGRPERGAPPRVSVQILHGTARLTLHLELPFPADLAALARAARDAAAAQVSGLTGTPVGEVTVLVERLLSAGGGR
ncbi:hypothetical protein OG871_26875 [Kitasatospora sp. NBC_00374]|uniref:hypothetical protein n=1 Tax=Kitasatospora sp. NBC_00374 TaxID=2975964 RepID=UPI0030E162D8